MSHHFSRYSKRDLVINDLEEYTTLLVKRDAEFIEMYRTAQLRYPSVEQIRRLTLISHIWKTGDRFYKLAQTYYDDANLWWIVPWFNQKPLESDIIIGDVVDVPLPLNIILNFFAI